MRNGGYGKVCSRVEIHERDFGVNKIFSFQDLQDVTWGEKNTIMALRSFLRQEADVIKTRLYLPEKPKPLSKIILNTCINLKQKNETEIETEIEILFYSFYFFLP